MPIVARVQLAEKKFVLFFFSLHLQVTTIAPIRAPVMKHLTPFINNFTIEKQTHRHMHHGKTDTIPYVNSILIIVM